MKVIQCDVCGKIVDSCCASTSKTLILNAKEHVFNIVISFQDPNHDICTPCFEKALVKLGRVLAPPKEVSP